tara:strand:+ start:535 stop:801 length:267 start_codon:yes stop_codon:yes gene_type:complete
MNIFKSIDNNQAFIITGLSYEMLSIIKTGLIFKLETINTKISNGNIIILENTNPNYHKQLKSEILFFKELKKEVSINIERIDNAIYNI